MYNYYYLNKQVQIIMIDLNFFKLRKLDIRCSLSREELVSPIDLDFL